MFCISVTNGSSVIIVSSMTGFLVSFGFSVIKIFLRSFGSSVNNGSFVAIYLFFNIDGVLVEVIGSFILSLSLTTGILVVITGLLLYTN